MPINARVDMLTTGIRTPVGVKVLGKDLAAIDAAAQQIEMSLRTVPGTRSVYAERQLAAVMVEIVPRRDALLRYGAVVDAALDAVDLGLGGMPVGRIYDGRGRYSLIGRFGRDFCSSDEDLAEERKHEPHRPASSQGRCPRIARVACIARPLRGVIVPRDPGVRWTVRTSPLRPALCASRSASRPCEQRRRPRPRQAVEDPRRGRRVDHHRAEVERPSAMPAHQHVLPEHAQQQVRPPWRVRVGSRVSLRAFLVACSGSVRSGLGGTTASRMPVFPARTPW